MRSMKKLLNWWTSLSEVEKASTLLGFKEANTIAEDIADYYTYNYVAQKGLEKAAAMDFKDDDVVLTAKMQPA